MSARWIWGFIVLVWTNSLMAQPTSGVKVTNPALPDLGTVVPPSWTKAFSPNPSFGGQAIALIFEISNGSMTTVSAISFTDTLPTGMVIATPPNTSNDCGGVLTANAGGSVISLSGGTLAAQSMCNIVLSVTAAAGGSYMNTAGPLTSSAGNSGTASGTAQVVAISEVSVSKDDGVSEAIPGATTTYTIVVSNDGPNADPDVSLTDDLPDILSCTYTSVASGGATGNTVSGMGDLSDTLSMPADSAVTYTVVCLIDPSASGILSNTAVIQGSIDITSGDDSATDEDVLHTPAIPLLNPWCLLLMGGFLSWVAMRRLTR